MGKSLLSVRELRAGYGAVTVLKGVSLEVGEGTITALLGANGAGKTTLMRALVGLVPAESGSIELAGEDMTPWASSRRVEAGVALVPEGRLVFPDLTVEENLRIGGYVRHARRRLAAGLAEVFDHFPILKERRRQRAGTLSGGEQQMLAIGRGLMARPRLLLLDEPSLGLAPKMAQTMFALIAGLNRSGLSILLAEQDVATSLRIAAHAYVLENGSRVMEGPAAALRADPRIRASYLGL